MFRMRFLNYHDQKNIICSISLFNFYFSVTCLYLFSINFFFRESSFSCQFIYKLQSSIFGCMDLNCALNFFICAPIFFNFQLGKVYSVPHVHILGLQQMLLSYWFFLMEISLQYYWLFILSKRIFILGKFSFNFNNYSISNILLFKYL